jgi:hypothetical protein
MCIIVRGVGEKGNDSWLGRRSVEMLTYHHSKKQANILFGLYIENLLPNKANYLEILHPGNVRFKLNRNPWPMPFHPDEPHNSTTKKSVLSSIYQDVFKYNPQSDELHQTRIITAWDSCFEQKEEIVNIWPKQETARRKNYIRRTPPKPTPKKEDDFCPFTTFRLGPFTKQGATLIALEIVIEGKSYDKLLGDKDVFTVDGPESLMIQTQYEFINEEAENKRKKWEEKLGKFMKYIGYGESYDVIIGRFRGCDNVQCIAKSGISKAPIQPVSNEVERFITSYPLFSLCLENESARIKNGEPVLSNVASAD